MALQDEWKEGGSLHGLQPSASSKGGKRQAMAWLHPPVAAVLEQFDLLLARVKV